MKKLCLILAAFAIMYSADARAQGVPTCESLGYLRTASECVSKGKEPLKCPFDSSKVYCGITACELVTAVTCSTSCKEYHSTCPSKCKTCTLADPCIASYNNLNFDYSLVLQKVQGNWCVKNSGYVSWNSGRFPIDFIGREDGGTENCTTWRQKKITEVDQHNALCSHMKITYSPRDVRCSTCCVGDDRPTYLSACADDYLP